MPTPPAYALKVPEVSPVTREDHERDWRGADRWGNNLPFFVPQAYFDYDLDAWSTASGTYTPYQGGGVQVDFSKFDPETDVRIDLATTFAKTANNGTVQFGVRVDGVTTFDIMKLRCVSDAIQHRCLAGHRILDKSVIAPGEHTIEVMARTSSGNLETDADLDYVSLICTEVIPEEGL